MLQTAERHFRRGAALYDAGKLDRALEEFERGQRAGPHPDFLYAMAQVHRRKGNCAQAIRLYVDFLASGPPRAEAERARANVERCSDARKRTGSHATTAPLAAAVESRRSTAAARPAPEDTYPIARSQRPPTLPRDMAELRTAFEMGQFGWRLPLAARVGLRDRVELAAGVDVLLAADPYIKSLYEEEPRSRLALDNARLSFALRSAVYTDIVGVRVALEAPVRSGSVPSASIDGEGADRYRGTIVVRDGLDQPGRLQVVVGLPVHFTLGRRVAIVGLDELLVVHTLPTSRPDIRAGLGVILTPGDHLSIILRHQIDVLQLHRDAVSNRTSLAVEAALGRWGDLGLSYSLLRRHPGLYFVLPPPETELDEIEMIWDPSLQLYAEKRF
jgi:tetratricopeptide (TPR) repeat protein